MKFSAAHTYPSYTGVYLAHLYAAHSVAALLDIGHNGFIGTFLQPLTKKMHFCRNNA